MNMKNVVRFFNHLLAEISGYLLLVMMLLLIIDFVMRGFFKPIHGLSDLAIFTIVTAIYFGLANCEEDQGHVKVEIMNTILPREKGRILNLITYAIAIFTLFICVWATSVHAIGSFISKEKVAAIIPMILWPAKFAVVIGLLFYFIQLVFNFIHQFKNQ
jgi:TRAP-type C4-dicarboxylate transport system permease small subunit